jgi:putative glutamine amidotransferase
LERPGDSIPKGTLWITPFEEYIQAIQYNGGAPIIIPAIQKKESLRAVLDRLEGLLLSGGPDINPKYYGEQPLTGLGETDEGLDQMELEAVRLAFQKDLPILAICRGIQILNVSLGGTLYQDISRQVPESISHLQNTDKSVNTHSVHIHKKTILFNMFRRNEILVNGKHHQAIKDLAPDLITSAHACDGIIEAVEHPKKRFVLGVQWHPEGTWEVDRYSKKIFGTFVQAVISQMKK